MKKYGVRKQEVHHCPECGENMMQVGGKLICLECEQNSTYGLDNKTKLEKGRESTSRWK